MLIRLILGIEIAFLLLTSCSKGATENLRGKSQPILASESTAKKTANKTQSSADQTSNPTIETSTQKTIVNESVNLQPLKLNAEADQSALPTGFMNDVLAIHKITANKTILFSKTKQSWLLDETKGGALSKLIVGFTPPAETTIYTLENKNFWLLSKTSLAFPSTIAVAEIGQINLVSLSPDLLKDPSNVNRVLFAGPQRFILANDKKANIIMLDGDKARIVAFDFPKVNDVVIPVYSAGLMFGNNDAYWFLSRDSLLILKKTPDNIWNWFISKYKLDAQGVPPDASLEQVAMLIEQGNDKNIFYVGRTYEIVAGKFYEQNAIKLSLDEALPVTIDPLFTSNIQPILKNNCISCHPGYDDLSIVKTKIDAYILLVGNLSMPKNSAILEPQLTMLKDYLAKIKAGN